MQIHESLPGSEGGLATAAAIAAAIGCAARSVRRELEGHDPDGVVQVNGNPTKAWRYRSLPESLQHRLAIEAGKRGYDSAERLLVAPPRRWAPQVPVGAVDQRDLNEAAALRKVLAPVLQEMQSRSGSVEDLVRIAQEQFHRTFGRHISRRHLDRLINRTSLRDGGAEQWDRLEIYLRDRVRTKRAPVVPIGFDQRWQPALAAAAAVENPARPAAKELAVFWDAVCACYEGAVLGGTSARVAKRELYRALHNKVPFIHGSKDALRVKFRRVFDRWRNGGQSAEATLDARSVKSGRRKSLPAFPEDFRLKLLARTHANGGRLAQSWREAITEGWMPPEVEAAYPFSWETKSYVPASVRAALRSDLAALEPLRVGPHNARLKGPCINRDYSEVPSGKVFQADDVTSPVWFYVTNPDGTFTLTRGQLLPWICARSQYIVTAQLIPEKGYDSIAILRGIAKLHDEYGLPEELYFENGVWASSLIAGRKERDQVPWADYQFGLAAAGVRVRFAQPGNPRAKIAENVIGQLQNRMNRLRGYAGRSPSDCPEDTRRALKLVNSGQAHPSEFFYSHEECMREYSRILNAFNEEPQNGKMLNGMSPSEAFHKFNVGPPIVLPPALRYLLARSRIETTVTARGVKVNRFTYKGEAASALIGQRVLAWFNPEDPDSICVTDLQHKNPVTLRRETAVPAFDATPEQIEQAQRENHAQTKHSRILFATLQKNFPEEFLRRRRRIAIDEGATAQLGQEMEAQRLLDQKEAVAATRLQTKGERLARSIGLPSAAQRVDQDKIDALHRLEREGIKVTNPYEE